MSKNQRQWWNNLLLRPEEEKALSEVERRQIFKEIVLAEDKGTKEAELRFPDDIMNQIDLERELQDKYKEELAKKHKLTMDQLKAIALEGVEKQWPMN